MSMKGKIVGTLLGFLGGPLGAIFGGVVGHFLDTALEEKKYNKEHLNWYSGRGTNERDTQIIFISTVIGLSIAAITHNDHNKQKKINAIISFVIDNVRLSKYEDQQFVERIVEETFQRKDYINIESLCTSYIEMANVEGRVLLVEFLFKLCSDGDYVIAEEEKQIHRIAARLLVPEKKYFLIKKEYLASRYAAFEILGVIPSASDSEIKKAYRRLARLFHPDRMVSSGDGLVKQAEEKFKSIQNAYNLIRQERGF